MSRNPRKALGRVARRYRHVAGAVDRASAVAVLPKLTASGLLDVDWYAALAGESFESAQEAGRHYLTVGRRKGLTPNPLFMPSHWMTGNWRASLRDPVVAYLRNSATISPHVLFDPAVYLESHPEALSHAGGPLGHFLSGSPSAELPVADPVLAPGRPWSLVRESMLAVAGQWREGIYLTRPRRTSDFNAQHGREVLAQALARPEPNVDDERPLVSVITPARNRQDEIVDAIRSVQDQSLANWQLLVVDDGSDDDTAAVVEKFAAADPRVRLIRHEPRGVSAARNAGLAEATGHWIAFLDSDNRWAPDFLQAMVRELSATRALAGYSAVELNDGESTWVRNFEGSLDDLLFQNHIDLNALVVDHTLLDRVGYFDESLRRMVDWDLILRIAAVTQIEHFPFIGVYYDDEPSPDRITTRETGAWADVVVAKHLIDWDAAERADRSRDLTSVVIVSVDQPLPTVRAVRSVLASADDREVEVVVVCAGLNPYLWGVMAATVESDPRVRVVRLPKSVSLAVGRNAGVAASKGSAVAFVDAGYVVRPGWLAPLLDELANPECRGAQALVLSVDGSVRSAGLAPPVGLEPPPDLLMGFPAGPLIERGRVPLVAASVSALAMRAATLIEVRGLDPLLTGGWDDLDFCLRVADGRADAFVLRTDAHVVMARAGADDSPGERAEKANREEFRRRWSVDIDEILDHAQATHVTRVAPGDSR